MASLILNETDLYNVQGRRIAINFNKKRKTNEMNTYFISDSITYYLQNAPHARNLIGSSLT